jgi:hypothetical protein
MDCTVLHVPGSYELHDRLSQNSGCESIEPRYRAMLWYQARRHRHMPATIVLQAGKAIWSSVASMGLSETPLAFPAAMNQPPWHHRPRGHWES